MSQVSKARQGRMAPFKGQTDMGHQVSRVDTALLSCSVNTSGGRVNGWMYRHLDLRVEVRSG